ncbi:MAG: dipeptidase PepE [Cryomorphaceae bacterium]|nr:dipeptidase PepE [Cryomorphaceae bacterium]
MSQRQLLLVSTSKIHGQGYMEYLHDELRDFFRHVSVVTFIPFARPGGISHDEYTQIAKDGFAPAGIKVKGVHEGDYLENINNAEAVFVGGGNTFVLTKTMHEHGLLAAIRARVNNGMPYMGSSAGTNLAGLTVGTTNDMPIVWPPSLEALQLIDFNINPHYLDPDPGSKHMGETRETRIKEFHHYNDQHVLGLREGSWLNIQGEEINLKGTHHARLFKKGQTPEEIAPGKINDFLL